LPAQLWIPDRQCSDAADERPTTPLAGTRMIR
jgi:hypothetical protein